MKILYLTFYFEPDLCAGSFRNTPIVEELGKLLEKGEGGVHVITTMPNRYHTYNIDAPEFEKKGNITIQRIQLPIHKSGLIDQILAFKEYFFKSRQIIKNGNYDIVVASSSRLFTAFLGATIARSKGVPLYLDIRDLFRDTITEVIKNSLASGVLNILLKQIENYTFKYATRINLVSEGFKSYFASYRQASYSYYTNGIDEIFLTSLPISTENSTRKEKYTILYAGNIGEGQGLHAIIPEAAKILGEKYQFLIIGDGGAKAQLENLLLQENINNVTLKNPINRKDLLSEYEKADFLFVHLNTLKAFERVLPSKIFEYGASDKPILAGLSGYAAQFVEEHLENSILFSPCKVEEMVENLLKYEYKTQRRGNFIENFSRSSIVKKIANDIVKNE